ncbi:MAG: nicotinate-nucleotide adenylyltransferase [Lachnospiraceae bacterium]|nr:nicotinate-nucleotide adenylyltransferase [Lachnospiraceae bacterium]
MGGSFNPIHIGHLIIAEKAREQFALDEVLFMPCALNYMKDASELLPSSIRAKMVSLAIEDNPFFTLSTMEIDKEGNTYTYETMESLKSQNPDNEYYFILGADSLWTIADWREPERIFASCTILAAVRDNKTTRDMNKQIKLLKDEFNADIYLLQAENIEISSSNIRKLVREGASIRYMVPEAVYDYIVENALYKSDILKC